MNDLFVRAASCAICGGSVIADFSEGLIYCVSPVNNSNCGEVPIPQWVIVDPYMRRKWIQNGDFLHVTATHATAIKISRSLKEASKLTQRIAEGTF